MEQLLIVNSILIWLVLLLNLFLIIAVIRRVNLISEITDESGNRMVRLNKEFLEVGQPAPDFTAETLKGSPVTMASYVGRKVGFIFLSPGCSPCREAIPTLEALGPQAKRYGVMLTLVITSDRERAQEFVREFDIRLPTLITSAEGKFTLDYKIGGTPFYCLINGLGHVEATGFFDKAWWALTDRWSKEPGQHDTLALSLTSSEG